MAFETYIRNVAEEYNAPAGIWTRVFAYLFLLTREGKMIGRIVRLFRSLHYRGIVITVIWLNQFFTLFILYMYDIHRATLCSAHVAVKILFIKLGLLWGWLSVIFHHPIFRADSCTCPATNASWPVMHNFIFHLITFLIERAQGDSHEPFNKASGKHSGCKLLRNLAHLSVIYPLIMNGLRGIQNERFRPFTPKLSGAFALQSPTTSISESVFLLYFIERAQGDLNPRPFGISLLLRAECSSQAELWAHYFQPITHSNLVVGLSEAKSH